ncbi:GTPase IMAP family member 4-like [Clarias gariepinus]|uniref:GTPase IMAP family member 4-like n=1 Tax=Clarias gariepinus TaxID=13013 RepID=UPI00234E081E|nr:GTPase IMAP family member 4-like [Clarias gariepinus]
MLLERTPSVESSASNILNRKEVAGRKVNVVNAPDWFSPGQSLENLRQDVGLYLQKVAPGPHAFLLVIPVKQSTGEERGLLENMEKLFGEECWRNTMIIFNVTEEKRNIEEFIKSADHVQRLVKKCGNRYHCLNIESEDDSQVSKLLEKIETMVKGTPVKFYSSKIYQETEKEIERMFEQAKRKAEGEMKEKPKIDDEFMKFLQPELWKYILTIKYKDEGNRSED